MTLFDNYEYFVLCQFLSEWPENYSYREIIANLATELGDTIWPTAFYEDMTAEDLVNLMGGMLEDARRLLRRA